jgi:hypothetical protein
LNSWGWLALTPCGPPSITTSSAPSIDSAERLPDTSKGTTPSLSPWMTRVGTVTLVRSSRKSVRPKAVMQSSVPFGEATFAICRAKVFCAPLTRSFVSPAAKKFSTKSSRKAGRSVRTPVWKASMVASSRPPSGLSSLWYRYGGTAAASTAEWMRSVP